MAGAWHRADARDPAVVTGFARVIAAA